MDKIQPIQGSHQQVCVCMHRLQLSLNLRDSPGFLATVPRPGRLYYYCIIGPGRGPDTSINTVVVVQLITYWW